jgi:hypothetical protein
MNSRERFLETINRGIPDRVPYFEEGIRDDVFQVWKKQGLKSKYDLHHMYPVDRREELEIDGYPHPPINDWQGVVKGTLNLEKSFKAGANRLPGRWKGKVSVWKDRDHVLMLEVHHGFFLSTGVMDWERFYIVMESLKDHPHAIREIMSMTSEMLTKLTTEFLEKVKVDAVIFSEPIGRNNGPIISPLMYEEFVLNSYIPLLEIIHKNNIKCVIFRTYANARRLIPQILKYGFNCLWACEVNNEAMDYRSIRKEFGKDLNLIGGIDLDVLRLGKEAIQRELEEKVPPLLSEGGYVPLADGRVRSDIPLENYLYYREMLQVITRR